MHGIRIRPVVFVDFDVRRHALLVDEHAEADAERFFHPGIADSKDFDLHAARFRRAAANFQAARGARVESRAMQWRRIHLCTGILERDGCVLLVASRYPNHAQPLWNLPGGRQQPPETAAHAVAREFLEETELIVDVDGLAYVAESFDHSTATQFTNFAFRVRAAGEPHVPIGDAHAVACAWVPRADLAAHLEIAVVREPLLRHLSDERERYFGFGDPGITIEFVDEA
ncbi:MAG: hypothetical protein NVS3B28_19290 [Candidatus Velthaea sp.]